MRTMLIALALIATTAQAQQYDFSKPSDVYAYWEQRRQEQRLQALEHRQLEMERKQREVDREVTCRGSAYEAFCRAIH